MSFGMEGSGNTLNITNTGSAIGTDITDGTTGSVLFVGAGPVLAQDNANLFWDNTNKHLNILPSAPGKELLNVGTSSPGSGALVNIISQNDMSSLSEGLFVSVTDSGGAASGAYTGMAVQVLDEHDAPSGVLGFLRGANLGATGSGNGGTTTDLVGVQLYAQVGLSPVTNATAVLIDDVSGAVVNNIALKTGLGLVSFGDQLTVAASTTGHASLNIPAGAAPSSPVDGDIWREDNTNTGLKIRVNGVTKTITLS